MKSRRDVDLRTAEEAAQWLYRLKDGGGADCSRAFTHWLKQSPRNVQEFLMIAAVSTELDALDAERKIDVEALIRSARANPVPLRAERGQSPKAAIPKRGRFGMVTAVAAGLSVIAVIVAAWHFELSSTYSTATGEQRSVKLEDGSLIYMNTQSSVRVDYTAQARDVTLQKGEALFEVAHDADRPFRVTAGDTIVRAIGTQFNVLKRVDATTVSVVEGKVQVWTRSESPIAAGQSPLAAVSPPMQLIAGEQARVVHNGDILKDTAPDIGSRTAWRQRRLVFRDTELALIVAEFNRYNRTPQFHIASEAIATRRYTGTFDADDPRSLEQLLTAENGLVLENRADEILIRASE